MKIQLVQLNPVVGALEANLCRMTKAIEEAKVQGAELVVLPEMVVSGYPPKDLLCNPQFVAQCLEANQTLAELSTPQCALIWGNVVASNNEQGKPLMNGAYCAMDGEIIAVAQKAHLPTYDVFDEARYFEPAAPEDALVRFEHQGNTIAVCVCEDLWSHPVFQSEEKAMITPVQYHSSPLQSLAVQPPDVLVNVSASPYVQGKPAQRKQLLKQLVQATQFPVVYASQVGANDDLIFDGSSCVTWPNGEQLAAQSFVEQAVWADLNQPQTNPLTTLAPEEEVIEALTLGIQDYVTKTGFSKVFVGLSGGLDSSLTAALAVRALGPAHVVGVAMPGPYSSQGSVVDAHALAQNLGMEYRQYSIDSAFEEYVTALSNGQRLEDLAEQNLQARLRGVILMTLANREHALVLATGNKSEIAMGYCTLYGDTCGALAPIGDVFKTQAYALSHTINQHTGTEIIPASVLTKPPSAELAPNQKDTDALPPYDVLDSILEVILEKHLEFEALLGLGYDETTIRNVMDRLMRSEFKRQQLPPALKISKKAFGSGRPYPIVQGYQHHSMLVPTP